MQKSAGGTWIAPQLHLTQHPGTDFFVRIIRDAPTAFGKIVRYLREDCIAVGVSTDHSIDPRSGYAKEWAQVQLVLAYALTIHKSQGVTMPVSYPALQGTFGFGMPYTLLTRTPFSSNMLFVGVPPKDIYEAILTRLADKRRTVQVLLDDESALESSLRARIQSGEFDLSAIGKRLVECDAFDHLMAMLRKWNESYYARLTLEAGHAAMLRVSEGFKLYNGRIEPYANRKDAWRSLAAVLQGDEHDRKRIQFYKGVATDWMPSKGGRRQ